MSLGTQQTVLLLNRLPLLRKATTLKRLFLTGLPLEHSDVGLCVLLTDGLIMVSTLLLLCP